MLASAAILVLLTGTTAAFANTSQSLSMTIPIGGVTNLGTQTYTVGGGQVIYAAVDGQSLDPGANLQYFFVSTQSGSSTMGYGYLRLTGTIGGSPVTVSGSFGLDSIEALTTIGSSQLPGFFVSSTPNIQMTMGGSTMALAQPFAIESPYLNPFGGPIVLTSADGYTLTIVATYSTGTILWTGTQLMGSVSGTLGGTTSVSGMVTLTGDEFEDLVAGTANDAGQISFSGMTPSSLNVSGNYLGSDTIPTTGTIDCSAYTGIPGTCTETGFQSSGSFSAQGMRGSYTTTWSTPALEFFTTIQATVTQQTGYQGHGGNFGNLANLNFERLFGFFGFFSHW